MTHITHGKLQNITWICDTVDLMRHHTKQNMDYKPWLWLAGENAECKGRKPINNPFALNVTFAWNLGNALPCRVITLNYILYSCEFATWWTCDDENYCWWRTAIVQCIADLWIIKHAWILSLWVDQYQFLPACNIVSPQPRESLKFSQWSPPSQMFPQKFGTIQRDLWSKPLTVLVKEKLITNYIDHIWNCSKLGQIRQQI